MSEPFTFDDQTEYAFSKVFDLKAIQKLQDLFSAATGVASIITEPDGTPITEPSGFCSLCNKISKTEEGLKRCLISDSINGSPNQEGPRIRRCLSNGLLEGGASIIVGGRYIADWLIGQVVDKDYKFEDTLPLVDVLEVKCDVYKDDLIKVKLMSKQQFENVYEFLSLYAKQLSNYVLKNINLTHEINKKIVHEVEIKKLNCELELKVKQRTSQLEESNAELKEINVILEETNIELEETNALLEEEITKRHKVEEELKQLNEALENKVKERTIQLQDINSILEEEIIDRKRAESDLTKEKIFTDAIFNSVPGIIYLYDDRSKLVRWNHKHEEMTGYLPEELASTHLLDWFRDDQTSIRAVLESIQTAKQNGFGNTEADLQTKHGSKIPMYFTASPVTIDGKRYFAGLGIDITKRKRVEEALKASEVLFRTIFEQAPLGIALSDSLTGRNYHINSRFAEIVCRTAEELTSTDWMSITHPDDVQENLDKMDLLIAGTINGFQMNKRYLRRDNSVIWTNMTISRIQDKDMEHPRHLCMIEDITESKLVNERLQKYQILAENANDAMLFIDREGNILEANDAAVRIYGYTYKEFSEMNISDLRHSNQLCIIEQLEAAHKEGIIFETVHYLKDGTAIDVEVSSQGTFLGNKRVLLSIVRDITDRKRKEDENRYLSYHDVLTGLYNRRFYEETIERLDIERNLPISIIMGDVNGLKVVNDAFGHDAGDELLRKAAAAIRSACRTADIVARWGGDEFVILLPKTKPEDAEEIINRVKKQYSNVLVKAIRVSISFGWATKTRTDEDIFKVLKNAEDAMYKHKIIQNEGMRGNTISTIINTLHEKNPREEQHSQRVGEISQSIGKAIGFSEIEVSRLKVIGLLHDIGKIAIEEGILNKPGKLTEREWQEIKRHPDIGYRILSSSSNMLDLADCILSHHERWDGKGYPKGLKGEAIPRIARIIALADSYDAMTSERPYRKALTKEEIVLEIRKNAGTQFDPDIARIFVEKVLAMPWDS